ncbi:MAG: HAD-IB family hydrolase [Acidovorax sp.]|jgi:phosphatidylglycerophosphatase C|nr:HAD-IB family hydrolase [Acidovorax sp.]
MPFDRPAHSVSSAPVAAFDFDGTLSVGDSLQDFARYSLGRAGWLWAALRTVPALLAWRLGWGSRQQAKQVFLRACWGGQDGAVLQALGERYARERLPQLLRPEMLELVQQHRALGHRLVLVSASPAFYLRPWALQAGFDAVLATELDLQGRFTAHLHTPNCWGPQKVERLAEWLQTEAVALAYAYGDSRGDREMLACAQHPWLRGSGQPLPPLS